MNAKIPNVPPDPPGVQCHPLLVRCVTSIPHFFKDIPESISIARSQLQADSTDIVIEDLPNGFLLHVDSFRALRDACTRLWALDVTASTGVREFGLWDVEVLKNTNNEEVTPLLRGIYLLCEKVVPRKKTEACKSASD